MKGIYGVNANHDFFSGMTGLEIAQILQSWNIDSVWGCDSSNRLIKTLQRNGIHVYSTVNVFNWSGNKDDLPITLEGKPLSRYPPKHPGNWYMGNCPSRISVRERVFRDVKNKMKKMSTESGWILYDMQSTGSGKILILFRIVSVIVVWKSFRKKFP